MICKSIPQRLIEKGINPTQQRLGIAEFMLCKPQHLSAEQILDGMTSLGLKVSKATVYNTLKLFVRQGILREVLIDPERVFYDSNTQPHFHIFNIDSGELYDLAPDQVTLDVTPMLPNGLALDSMDIVFKVKSQRIVSS